eukprot:11517-Heterococcus_DN1.PRE.1
MASPPSTQEMQATVADPLRDACIVKQVFAFLPGHWLFLGTVCKEWEALYADMAEQQLYSCNLLLHKKTVTCGIRTTLYSAAVASPATVRLAFYCGLDIFTQAYDDNESLQVVAGLHADAETLDVLHDRGMEFSDMLLKAVALS